MDSAGMHRIDWDRAVKRIRNSAGKYRIAVRICLIFYIFFALALCVWLSGWVNPWLVIGFTAATFLAAAFLTYSGLYRWQRVLDQPVVKNRIAKLLAEGPGGVSELFNHTPRPVRFILGSPPKTVTQTAAFVGHHLRWFISPPMVYLPAVGLAVALVLVVVLFLLLIMIGEWISSYYYSLSWDWWRLLPLICVLHAAFMYFIYLLERQVLAVKHVAGIVRELAAAK